jgi:orotidine-5'-phosphate decarboxylase
MGGGSLGSVSAPGDQTTTAVVPFSDRVAEAVEHKRSQLVVGLDPRIDLLPVELRGEAVQGRAAAARAVERFCKGIVDAVAPYVVAVKPQLAFFEELGSDGWVALESVSRYASEAGLLVIADGKRGDIGSTARAYAAAFLEPRGAEPPLADALTVNPYLGSDSIDPFLSACRNHGAGLFCLVRTSNAGGRDIQDAVLSDGTPVWRHVAGLVDEWGADLVGERGMSSVGAVVGATVPRIMGDARRAMPQAIILLPGVGAQGATPADVARAFTSGPASGLVNASRSVIFAYRETEADWRDAAGAEAARLAAEIWSAAGW